MCVYGLADAIRYCCLQVKEKLPKIGVIGTSTDPVIFYWKQNGKLVGIQICHVDNIDSTWKTKLKNSVIWTLKKIACQNIKTFTYTGIKLKHN